MLLVHRTKGVEVPNRLNSYCERTGQTVSDGFEVVATSAAPRRGELFSYSDAPGAKVWIAKKNFDIALYVILSEETK